MGETSYNKKRNTWYRMLSVVINLIINRVKINTFFPFMLSPSSLLIKRHYPTIMTNKFHKN